LRFKATLAVPLVGKEGVLGVLDIGGGAQKPAFDDRDVRLAELFAAQVAGALENLRLLRQTQTALKELEASNRLLARKGWQGYLEQPQASRRAEIRGEGAPTGESLSEPLVVPLELRGQPMGRLTLRREGGAAWSDDEIEMVNAIALQTSLAADNVRLIEQTRQALDDAQALYQTGREITAAGDISGVLSAVLDNLARTGIHAAAVARFDAPTRENARHIELASAWDHTGTPRLAPGVRFAIADFPLFNRITSEAALVSQDLLSDPEIDEMAKALLGGLGFRAMAITPLVARGQWIGLLFALVEQAHAFTPSELDFQRALADQAALAIDGRHLLAETERRAKREQLIRQITTRIRAASDIQGVLETTATELARSMRVSRSIVRLTMGNDRGME
jgi:GAF domain-containing protein